MLHVQQLFFLKNVVWGERIFLLTGCTSYECLSPNKKVHGSRLFRWLVKNSQGCSPYLVSCISSSSFTSSQFLSKHKSETNSLHLILFCADLFAEVHVKPLTLNSSGSCSARCHTTRCFVQNNTSTGLTNRQNKHRKNQS